MTPTAGSSACYPPCSPTGSKRIGIDDFKRKVMNERMLVALHQALDQAEQEARAVLLLGREGVFSAGFDLQVFARRDPQEIHAMMRLGAELALQRDSKPAGSLERFMFKPFPVLLASLALPALPSPAFGQDVVVLDDQGIKTSILDGELTVHVGGKLHLDALAVDGEPGNSSDAEVRRARVNLRIDYQDILTVRAEREFAGSRGWRNLYLQVKPAKGTLLQAGQFNVPFSLEDMQSTNIIPFPERSLAAALTSEFAVGLQVGYSGKRFTARTGWFGNALDTPTGRAPALGRGVVGRATVLAVDSGRTKLHFGVGLERRSFGAADTTRYVAESGSTFGPRILRTPQLSNLDRRSGYNAEVAFFSRNFALQGQYIEQHIRQTTGRNRRVSGGYAQMSWVLTGQPYRYSRSAGIATGPDLGRKKTAVELSGRVSWLDAENTTIDGGIARSVDVSAGLYLGRNFRLLVSGTQSRYRERIGAPIQHVYVAVTRAQIAF